MRQFLLRRCTHGVLALVLIFAPVLAVAAELKSDIARALETGGITGAVWGTLDEHGNVRTEAAGLAAAGRTMRPDDRVQVGSIAKMMLATGVLRLVSEGRLSLDTPVADLLPGLVFDNVWDATDPVRLRHLLDHTAGLDDMRLGQFFSLKATPDTPLAQATDTGRPLRVRSRPGSRFSYSNTGYALLGRVIEQATGQRYEVYLDTHLLAPLAMHDSTFRFVTQVGAGADRRLAMGHFENAAAHPAIPLYLRPAAQFTTTTRDMLRFGQFLMGDGYVDGRPFIDPALMRARGYAKDTEAARAGLRVGYSLGLALRDRHGAVGLCHGGDTVGFRAMLCVYPDHRRAFFVAFNADVEGADYAGIRGKLVEAIGVAGPDGPGAARPPANLNEWAGFYVPSPNRFASFAWLDTVFGFVRVTHEAGGLQLRSLQSEPIRLAYVGDNLFRESGRVLPSHVALVAADGARVIANDHQTYARIPAIHLAALWLSLVSAIVGFLYIGVVGLARVLRRRPWRDDALRAPLIAIAALVLPALLMLRQSFLQMGDLTAGSILLAVVTAMLPIALAVGLFRAVRTARTRRAGGAIVDAAALVLALQGWVVLAAWGLMPIRMWAV
jgi:CubicO group peptidase (beta-lactamase class C family)